MRIFRSFVRLDKGNTWDTKSGIHDIRRSWAYKHKNTNLKLESNQTPVATQTAPPLPSKNMPLLPLLSAAMPCDTDRVVCKKKAQPHPLISRP